MTSAKTARLLGVGPTSVKRWADAGLLTCVRTAGGHRRFARAEVERFQSGLRQGPDAGPGDLERWVRRLEGEEDLHAILSALLSERARLSSWWRTADLVGEVLGELGRRWQQGKISVLDEHLASERLSRALAHCAESIALGSGAPRVLLASALSDEHTLGLQLAELCLRERGWNVVWGGRAVPEEELERRVRDGSCRMLGLSAAANLQDSVQLENLVRRIGGACAQHGVTLLLGGQGAWPEPGPGLLPFLRVRSFRDLDSYLGAARG